MVMACISLYHLNTRLLHTKFPKRTSSCSSSTLITSASTSWDDVFRSAKPHDAPRDSSDSNLHAFFDRIKACNRGSEMRREFLPFVVEERIVGYVHNQFAEVLRGFKDVFEEDGDCRISLCRSLASPEERTDAVGEVIRRLGEGVIPGIRNELYPVTSSFGAPVFFSLERAAAPYFGIKAYGIHMNGFVDRDGEKFLWIGKRSNKKPTFPGMLDHLVAGGLPHDVTCKENVLKECEEEAGIPRSLAKSAVQLELFLIWILMVSYVHNHTIGTFVWIQQSETLISSVYVHTADGEVDSFKLIPVTDVANIIRRTKLFKPNCSLVIIDFLFRHGFITPEESGYLQLLESLRSGDCS
ncbi:hypothetical protein Sjap_019398 [Stephania japonica]|uniref:Nudix hydrolase domain-containing protein n=1 Tax=Stephania japonica TaxID=461633 RepID=A0AAP0F7L6_9MAGN